MHESLDMPIHHELKLKNSIQNPTDWLVEQVLRITNAQCRSQVGMAIKTRTDKQ